jgi:hypothetical protein
MSKRFLKKTMNADSFIFFFDEPVASEHFYKGFVSKEAYDEEVAAMGEDYNPALDVSPVLSFSDFII